MALGGGARRAVMGLVGCASGWFRKRCIAHQILHAADDMGDKTFQHAAVLEADLDACLVLDNGFAGMIVSP